MDAKITDSQEKAYVYLKDAIISLRFRPNERLRTTEIAAAIRLSRTPVREALGRLEQERLVRRDHGSGYVVQAVRIKDVLDLYRVRESLEVEAALEAMAKLGASHIAELSAILRDADALLNQRLYDEFLMKNRAFFLTIARLSGNDLLLQMLGMINDRVKLVGALIVRLHEPRTREIVLENKRILKALKSRNAASLEAAVRAHIQRAREHVITHISQETSRTYLAG